MPVAMTLVTIHTVVDISLHIPVIAVGFRFRVAIRALEN